MRFTDFGRIGKEKIDNPTNPDPIPLTNTHGVIVKILTIGAAIYEVRTPDRCGVFQNIAMQLGSGQDYAADASFAGATLGPNAGRIRGGLLPIGGAVHHLRPNDGPNQLHGGARNFSRVPWRVEAYRPDGDGASLRLSLDAPDGLEGYPGRRRVSVTYTLDGRDRLTLHYAGETTRPTWLNLSNHAYWNLSGDFSAPAFDHLLCVRAGSVWYNGAGHLPSELRRVDGTPFDFRRARPLRGVLDSFPDDGQLAASRGWNNAFVLDGAPAAVLTHPGSGRRLTVETDYPALVFYSGGFLGPDTRLSGDIPASPGCALALEAQEFPDAPNLGAPCRMLSPGETWERTIRFSFGLAGPDGR